MIASTTPSAASSYSRNQVSVMGLPISVDSHSDVLEAMDDAIKNRRLGRYISITNTESMYHGCRLQSHGEHIKKADFSLCDGVGVIVAGWAWGHRISRFNGPILQLEVSEFGEKKNWRHFFYGGKEGVAEEMARRLRKRFPELNVCGLYCPPFRDLDAEEDSNIIEMINEARPDIVWVGLGLVKQELWIQRHLSRIRAPWMIGVGAAFDYHAGSVPWAPPILRMIGLEWLFRLSIQPKLRAKRYWWSLIFVIEAMLVGLFTLRFLRRS